MNNRQSRTQADRTAATQQRLITHARALFAAHGYANVGLAEIVEQAGVTKGALYHHFGSKDGLFRAVITRVQQQVADQVTAAAEAHDDPWQQLLAGCHAFLAASRDPVAQRIMLIDGPAVLGWSEWRGMDAATSQRTLHDAITGLVEAGILRGPVAPTVHLLSGAMNEAALWLADRDEESALDDTMRALTSMLDGLRT